MTLVLGTVIATPEGPSTGKFAFVIRAPGLRRGQFIQLSNEEGTVFAVVQDIIRANRYYERPESVRDYEQSGVPLYEQFPASAWDTAVAQCAILGAWNENKLARNAYPPAPGAKVHFANEELLKQFLGFREDGLHVGKLLNHDVPVKLGLSALLQKHLAILAMSGAGKSHLANVLFEELLERKKEHGRIAVVAFDVHGDYAALGEKKLNSQYADKVTVFDARQVRIATRHALLVARELLTHASPGAMRELEKIIYALKAKREPFGLADVLAAAEGAELKQNVKEPLLSAINELAKLRLFGDSESPNLKALVKAGRALVIDFSEVTDLRRKQAIAAYLGKKLFMQRRKGMVPPFLLLVEEAHNFAKEKAPKESAISKGIIEKIAREGRKFGASLCLVSQRPVHLSTTALSQCNTFFILRVTNPYDLKHIEESAEAIDRSTLDQINGLKVGEGILLGEAVQAPVFIRVRQRNTKGGGKGAPLEKMAAAYEDLNSQVTVDDVKAFI